MVILVIGGEDVEENKLKLTFSFTDEFGQETTLNKTFTTDVYETTQLGLLFDEFKNFLIAAGHSKENVDQIRFFEE
jgi:hypothetical protein